MVDRVVLKPVEQTEQVRELERRGPVVAEQDLDAGDEVVQVGHLREHVVADDEARALPFVDEPLRRLAAEERHERRHAPFLRRLRDVRRRIDPEDRNPGADEVLQQVAVVRGELDDEVVRGRARGGARIISTYWRACSTQAVEYAEKYAYSVKISSGGTNASS